MATKILKNIARTGRRAARDFDFTWRYGLNFGPTLSYTFKPDTPTGEAARVLDELNRNGVAITSAQALLGSDSVYGELSATVEQLEREQADDLARARAEALAPEAKGQKPFLFNLLGKHPEINAHTVYGRFALQRPLVQVVNAYFGMHTSLRYYNIWHTFATQKSASQSQLWHRDPEDRYILKVFLHLSDVDAGAGPFTYAPETHPKGRKQQAPAYLYKDGDTPRSDDSQMAEVVPAERWVQGLGPKGTIVFADTRGYHKGGLARERDRILYTCEFTSRGAGGGVSTASSAAR